MKKTIFIKSAKSACSTLLLAGLLFTIGCKKADDDVKINKEEPQNPPAAIITNESSNTGLITELSAIKAKDVTPASNVSGLRTEGAATYIHFGDRTSCNWNPNICSNTFVVWPGYIQSTGGSDWGYGWMSSGPGTAFLPYTTGSHYHIVGLMDPATEPNPQATSMFGSDWFAYYMQRSGTGRINFDLTQINVTGVPITLWFKAANGNWYYWASLPKGRWNLPGATNIQEVHIRAASGLSSDHWGIDDILVRAL
ncbi:hypothetical protein [Sporocytophaga myxococcoides]|uniref:hypothetical protein n=1 Tax=Sporocytophaga myxococcoides TaxID=153721 RepID=UPI0003F74D6F|nr:hypothetical protein [Sporocytophaga myxococcoides]